MNSVRLYMKALLLIYVCSYSLIHASKNFVLIAAPGSGKGTFSQYVIERYGYVQICPGDLYRHEIKQQTELGKRIQPIIESGDYVDEETTCALIAKHLTEAIRQRKNFVIDGFPRSIASFNFLKDLLVSLALDKKVCFVQFVASDDCCITRVLQRKICTKCFQVYNSVYAPSKDGVTCNGCNTVLSKRPGDTLDIMIKRLAFFHATIEPIMHTASQLYETKVIDAEQPIRLLTEAYDALLA